MLKTVSCCALLALCLAATGCRNTNCCGSCSPGYDGPSCGCGETYWSEWFNDPPACKDPCNRCGQYIGHQGGGRHAGHNQMVDDGMYDGAYDGGVYENGAQYMDGPMMEGSSEEVLEPTPAPQPRSAKRVPARTAKQRVTR